jgi:hypothetical protein
MKSIRKARRLILTIAVILFIIDAAAIAWLLSPRGRGAAAHQSQLRELEAEYRSKLREVGPIRDMDKRLLLARDQQAGFFNGYIPSHYSAISETLATLASENHVQKSAVRYDAKDTDIPGLQRVAITASVTGDYPNEMRFINALERSKTFFVINSVNLVGAEGGTVRLELHLETFLRSAS